MAASEAQLRASKKYQQKFDKVQIRVPHDEKEQIDAHAERMGESVNTVQSSRFIKILTNI